jgi:IPT/TIG domain-containing protein
MPSHYFALIVRIGLVGFLAMSLGCSKSLPGPTSPSQSVLPSAPAATNPIVSAISPTVGLNGDTVKVTGTGFLLGATLRLDGVAARVTGITNEVVTAITPAHGAGMADIVVTNPVGRSGTLTGGFTYQLVTLTAGPNRITPEGQLSVSWVAPDGRSRGDWIALFRVGSPSTTYLNGWWEYTNGAALGTFILSAPAQPGEYEFRYLVDDGFSDVARSPVTVNAAASP